MFSPGDYVFNQKNRYGGQVIGYGHQMLNNVYMPTLKVLVTESNTLNKRVFVAEDLYSAWASKAESNTLNSPSA